MALVGLKFKIEVLALPLIGVGMLLRLTGEGSRLGAFGMVPAGVLQTQNEVSHESLFTP